jgi:hypothetical protein
MKKLIRNTLNAVVLVSILAPVANASEVSNEGLATFNFDFSNVPKTNNFASNKSLDEIIELNKNLGLHEGDMKQNLKPSKNQIGTLDTVDGSASKWNKNIYPAVYSIENSTPEMIQAIEEAMAEIKRKVPNIVFVGGMRHENRVIFTNEGTGCWSYIGAIGGTQTINLGSGCEYKGIVVHEILHSMGMVHEQVRKDRDSYVRIDWNEIESGKESNFKKNNESISLCGFDFDSIMLYSSYSFARGGLPTITKRNGDTFPANRSEMSYCDAQIMNRVYK